jgi:hypothetical protein
MTEKMLLRKVDAENLFIDAQLQDKTRSSTIKYFYVCMYVSLSCYVIHWVILYIFIYM